MNENKEIEQKSWIQEKGVPLRIEETNRTSQLGFDSYNFCRAFHGESSEKKSKFYHLSVQRYLQNKLYFFENLIFQKKLFGAFLRRWVRRRISSGIRPKFVIMSDIFFLFERA